MKGPSHIPTFGLPTADHSQACSSGRIRRLDSKRRCKTPDCATGPRTESNAWSGSCTICGIRTGDTGPGRWT